MPTQQTEQPAVDERRRSSSRHVEQLRTFRNYVRRELRRNPTGHRERDRACQRAISAIWSLSWVLQTLADENAAEDHVQSAILAADKVYRAASLNGELPEKHAAMQLVVAITEAASEVLTGYVSIEDVRFRPEFLGSDWPVSVDHDAFREAVRAWVESERAMQQRKRKGRIPDRWLPTFECLKRFGLQNGMTKRKSLEDTFQRARPWVLPLYPR